MLQITQDLTGHACPDFASPTYAAMRLAMTTGRHLNDAAAAEQLATAWNQMHTQEVEAWDLQAQADMAEQEEQHMIAEANEARLRAEDKRQKEDE